MDQHADPARAAMLRAADALDAYSISILADARSVYLASPVPFDFIGRARQAADCLRREDREQGDETQATMVEALTNIRETTFPSRLRAYPDQSGLGDAIGAALVFFLER